MNTKLFRKLEAAGGAVVFALASFLHFFYDITQGSILGALLGSVNESVWEHLKIFATAYLIWATIELLWAKPPLRKFVWAKALGLYFMCTSIALFFYTYTLFTGKPILVLDLASSLVFAALAHYLSYRITMNESNKGQYFYTGVMLIFLAMIMILCFTFYPPDSILFKDPVTGGYGIIPDYFDKGDVALDAMYLLSAEI